MKKKIIISLCLLLTTLNASSYAQHSVTTLYPQSVNTPQNLRQAFNWHHKSAIKGSIGSQYQLGLMFHYGSGVRQNRELAKLWFTRASKKGHPKAQSILLRFYSVKTSQFYKGQRTKYSMTYYR